MPYSPVYQWDKPLEDSDQDAEQHVHLTLYSHKNQWGFHLLAIVGAELGPEEETAE